jgi:hypothetical protein
MQNFTLSGVHQPDFMGFVDKKPQTYYYGIYIVANPESHKAFNVLLSDALFSESTDNKGGENKSTAKPVKIILARVQTMKRRLKRVIEGLLGKWSRRAGDENWSGLVLH